MLPHLHLITLGVYDLDRALRFYRDGLGFPPSSASAEDVVFFQLGGVALGLYPWDKLAEDAHLTSDSTGFRGVTLAYNTRSKEEVAALLAQAESAGGRIVKPAQDVFWGGHHGYFSDPDGHLWEVAWNPYFEFDERGCLKLP
jgi:catechol 2,3-dioxygenase-like lactoylglutathione lyase family enzyme